ncbi:MAG: pyridoxamine 5'-phosphate oxidase family protein [Desulfobacteraceae bacterium]|nr:pyridoxamine 5'-phosphate oxidase family protein [Desulfobacteraceae bacterium]
MRRNEKEIKDIEDIEAVISKARVCRLGLVDGQRSYIVPLCFGYKDKCLFFHSATQGRKIDLIKKNPLVCFEFDHLVKINKAKDPCKWGMAYESVIGEGTACLVNDPSEKQKALGTIMSQYSDRPFDFTLENIESVAVIRVDIEKMAGKRSQ